MTHSILKAITLLAVVARVSTSVAQGPATVRVPIRGDSKLWIEGTSNLHGWRCTSAAFDVAIDVTPAQTTEERAIFPSRLKRVEVKVPVRRLACDHGGMDNNLYKALEVHDASSISYTLGTFEFARRRGKDAYKVQAVGMLSVAGKQNSVTMNITAERLVDGSVKVAGEVPILMTDFGVTPPTVLLGTLRTGNRVIVKFELFVSSENAVAAVGTPKS